MVFVQDVEGKQVPAIIVEVEDVPHGQPIGAKLFIMYKGGYSADPNMWWYQGNDKGEWQWPDLPLK